MICLRLHNYMKMEILVQKKKNSTIVFMSNWQRVCVCVFLKKKKVYVLLYFLK